MNLSLIEQAEPEETFTFKRSHFYSILTVPAFAAGVLLGYVVWGFDPGGARTVTAAQAGGAVVEAPVTAEPQFIRYDVPSEGFPSIGPKMPPSPWSSSATINVRTAAAGTSRSINPC
jgi:hypothetical protein